MLQAGNCKRCHHSNHCNMPSTLNKKYKIKSVHVQLAAEHCTAPQSTTEHCIALQLSAKHCKALQSISQHLIALKNIAEHCRSLQSTAEHYKALQSAAQPRIAHARHDSDKLQHSGVNNVLLRRLTETISQVNHTARSDEPLQVID